MQPAGLRCGCGASDQGAQWAFLVVALGTGFHFATDIVSPLGADGEHHLMHLMALGAVGALAWR